MLSGGIEILAELFDIFFQNIVPILLIVALGYVVGRGKDIDPRSVGRVIFYIFSPALIFYSLATNTVQPAELVQIVLVMLVFVVLMTAIGLTVGRSSGASRLERASVVLGAICPNNGNFGLPLIGFAFDDEVLARAVVVYIVVTFLNYTAGIFVASSGQKAPLQALGEVLRVPTIYAAIGGFAINALGLSLPLVVERPVALLAQAAVPAMLVLLGLQLSRVADFSKLRLVGLSSGLRLLVSPFLAYALLSILQVQGPAFPAIMMQASMPVAVVTIIFATEYGLDVKQMSSTILLSTLLSPVTLSVLIFILTRTPIL